MWKKADTNQKTAKVEPPQTQQAITLIPQVQSQDVPVKEKSVIGKNLIMKGDLVGEDDILIQGQMEGTVYVKNNQLQIGRHGHLKANVYAKTIFIEGHLVGNAYANEQIIVRKSGCIRGNLIAPRVTIEDGAILKGSIDMEKEAIEKCFPQEKNNLQKQIEPVTIADAIHTPTKNHQKLPKNEKTEINEN